MKKNAVFIIFLFALTISACDIDWVESGESYNNFNYNLRGTWQSSSGSCYFIYGLTIDYNSIIVSGTNVFHPDNPIKNFTLNAPLKGYSELIKKNDSYTHTGNIFIYDRGEYQEGITYLYWENKLYGDAKRKFLTFSYGSYNDTLEYIENDSYTW
ncbi:MAG: hypothetical protein FWB86_09205 [Treponema sp.]|nr:hypothetical protein [Treponema sp.]MCL2251253.1 hypothetical protein [Treponema sp.]